MKRPFLELNSDHKATVLIVGIIAIFFISLAVCITRQVESNNDTMMSAFDNGYQQQVQPGSSTDHWVKK